MVPSHLHTAMTQLGRMLWLPVALQLLNIAFYTPNCAQHNPHQPQNLTWVVLDTHADILNSTSSIAVPGSWFPDLYFDFGTMMDTTISHKWIKRWPLYVCPGLKKDLIKITKTTQQMPCQKRTEEEGGVCGKFNLTNCCIEIDSSLKAVDEAAIKMVKLAHVPVQTWRGLNWEDAFSGWWPKLPGLQAIVALVGMIALGCIVLPCVLPIFVRTITNSLSLLTEKRAVKQVNALFNYQPVPPEDAMERYCYKPVQSGEDLEEASLCTLDSDDELEFVNSIQLRRSMLTLDGMESKDLIPQEDMSLHEKTKTEEMLE